jgi:hypothetical protein
VEGNLVVIYHYVRPQNSDGVSRALAYPYGRYTAETEAIARGCGYTYAFDTDGRVDCKYLEDHLLAAR